MASKTLIFIGFTLIITSCSSQTANDMRRVTKDSSETEKYFENNQGNEKASTSLGTVSKGSLINGKLMPFEGDNFYYFDTASYLNHRAYVNHDLKNTLLDGYSELDSIYPGRAFVLMECSNKKGGKLFPHRTHQNGLSVDFMMPLIKKNRPFYDLDSLGSKHYLLHFDNTGRYSLDSSIRIDFKLVAQHLLVLEKSARKHGLRISKVIINTDLKDELFSSNYGQKLKSSPIYVVQKLSPLINSFHDDHYHVDFAKIE